MDGRACNVEVKVGHNVAPLTMSVVTINQTEPISVTSRSQRPGWPISSVIQRLAACPSQRSCRTVATSSNKAC